MHMSTIENDIQQFRSKINTASQLIDELNKANKLIHESSRRLDELNAVIANIDKLSAEAKELFKEEHKSFISETGAVLGSFYTKFNDELIHSRESIISESKTSFENINSRITNEYSKNNETLILIKNKLEETASEQAKLKGRIDNNQSLLINLLELDQKRNRSIFFIILGMGAFQIILLLLSYMR